jgi:hypothetical protein
VDLYGPAHRCLSRRVTLMSCTAGAIDDPTLLMGLDPIHRQQYGWLQSVAYRPGTNASCRLQPGAVPDPVSLTSGAVNYLRPGRAERFTFEVRNSSAFDRRLPGSGLYVWYDDPAGRLLPMSVPSLSTPGQLEPAAFVPGPDHCALDPMSRVSRGAGVALAPGTYRLHWLDDTDSGTLLTVHPADRRGRVRFDLHRSSVATNCPGRRPR